MSNTSTRSREWNELKKLDIQARKAFYEFSETPLGQLRMEGARPNTYLFCSAPTLVAPTLAQVMWQRDMFYLNKKAEEMGVAPASAFSSSMTDRLTGKVESLCKTIQSLKH